MGCNSCASGKDGTPKGCKNNGTCGTDGCNKLTVFDWLSNMQLPENHKPNPIVEVRFKNGRKEFYNNAENLSLHIGDVVATEAHPGHDIGTVSLTGELVKVQMKKKKVDSDPASHPKIYRIANQKDIDVWQKSRSKEEEIKVKARQIAIRLNLKMKISDIEFQGDGSKVIFYYTADQRVDFRQLIKEYAYSFKVRIEMKQIGLRQEAARLGGIGSCGRELCCSTWLTDFRSVKTSAARYQQLSLNPIKLAGQCGKLKCCLNYELDMYMEALKDFPKTEIKLNTKKGKAAFQKMDIFNRKMWYAYYDEPNQWHELKVEDVNSIIKADKANKPVECLEDFVEETTVASIDFNNVVGQDSLTRFDKPARSKRRNKRNKRRPKTPKKNKE
jgi:cell fate regulator YaaT (PSP1 superfamily)